MQPFLRFTTCSNRELELVVHGKVLWVFVFSAQSDAILSVLPLCFVEDQFGWEDVPVGIGLCEVRASRTQVYHQTLAQAAADKDLLAQLLQCHQRSLLAHSSLNDFWIEIDQCARVLEERGCVSSLVPYEQVLALLVRLLRCNLDLSKVNGVPGGNVNVVWSIWLSLYHLSFSIDFLFDY